MCVSMHGKYCVAFLHDTKSNSLSLNFFELLLSFKLSRLFIPAYKVTGVLITEVPAHCCENTFLHDLAAIVW